MRYTALAWSTQATDTSIRLIELSAAGYQESCQWTTRICSQGTDTYTMIRTEGSGQVVSDALTDAPDAWVTIAQQAQSTVYVVYDRAHYHAELMPYIEQIGYAPPADSRVIACVDLLRMVYPGMSYIDIDQTYGGAATSVSSLHALMTTCIDALRELPVITRQVYAQTWLDHPAMQELCNDLLLHAFVASSSLESSVKIIHELAFRQMDDADEDVSDTHGQDELRELGLESISLLRESLPKVGQVERRVGQETMIKAVAETLTHGGHLVVEAGTGTGKSLGYLLPSLLYATQTGHRVVISTHTIALQEQLRQKDLALIEASGAVSAKTAILKGRTHYLCLRKLANHVQAAGTLPASDRIFTMSLAVWVTRTSRGDREELAMNTKEIDTWRTVQSESESCINKRCPFFRDCFYFRARQRAYAADVVITNHSLVLSDLKADHRVLPPYDHLVIDEAHQLEDQATKQLGAEVAEGDIKRLYERLAGRNSSSLSAGRNGSSLSAGRNSTMLNELTRRLAHEVANAHPEWQVYAQNLDRATDLITRTMQETKDLFTTLEAYVSSLAQPSQELRIRESTQLDPRFGAVRESATLLSATRRLLAGIIREYESLPAQVEMENSLFGQLEDLFGVIRELTRAIEVCTDVLLLDRREDQFVGWAHVRTGRYKARISLHLAPLSVSDVLENELFRVKSTVILTSATLSVARSFQYFLSQIGLTALRTEGVVSELLVESPFHYDRQAVVCIPSDMPDVRNPAFLPAAGRAISQIATAAHGRTLVLFTSYHMLESVYRAEYPAMQRAGLRILAQGYEDHRRSRLIDTFKTTDRAVLFGVASFWEGIDIPGDDLTCLVIVKLPFAVPTFPIVEARNERITARGGNPFAEYAVPQAVIRFTQGFGRLIRTQADRGAVFVLDRRITQTGYGKTFLSSLPNPAIHRGTLQDAIVRSAALIGR